MDHKNLHNESMNLVKELRKNIEKQTVLVNAKLNDLPPEKREMLTTEQAELNQVLKVAGNGNIKDLQKIVEKYANTSSK